jgi:hypothetical protein
MAAEEAGKETARQVRLGFEASMQAAGEARLRAVEAKERTEKALAAVSAEEEVALIYVAKNVIPASVDLLISAANGQLNLKKLAKTGWTNCMSCLPVAAQQLRGPAWDIAEKFVKAAEKTVAAGGSVKDVVAAGVAAAEAAVVVEVKEIVADVAAAAAVVPAAAAAVVPVAPVAPVVPVAPVAETPAATTTPSS